MSQKRKIDSECRVFQSKWEIAYFFIEWKGKPLCLICNQTVAVCKEFNLKRHYDTNHKSKFDCYTEKIRMDTLSSLKSKLQGQQSMFTKANTESEDALKSSFIIALEIAKRSKPFTDGDFIKDCMLKVADVSFPFQKSIIQNISLSRNTVASRINDLSQNLVLQLKEKIKEFTNFSLAVDESTDTVDTAQLAVFIRGINSNFEITEELLKCVPLTGTTTANDIYSAIEHLIAEYELDWNILSSTTTDGAPAMAGKHSGVVTKLKQKTSGNFVGFHCIIHQESLASKHLKMDHVMQPIIKIVNFIRSRGLNHRQFRQFLQDLDEKFSDVPYFTEVRWLSRGVVLERFFALRDPIEAFMLEKGNPIDYDNDWWVDCAFLVDMNKHLTDLNVKLQGKNLIVTQMYSCIQSFETKLRLWENQVKNQTLDHFPHLKSFGTVNQKKLDQYSQLLQNLITEFNNRFEDFHKMNEMEFPIFNNPFNFEASQAPVHLQMELIDLQSDSILKEKFKEVNALTFYTQYFKSLDNYPELKKHAARILCMFGSTYLCEQMFSVMKINKNKHRTRLTNEHLQSILKIITTNMIPDINELVKNKRSQVSRLSRPSSSK